MRQIIYSATLAILLLPQLAFAKKFGPSTGGGGQGVLCIAPNGQPTLETLDLYEAKNIWGYQIPTSGDLPTEINRVYPNIALQRDIHVPAVKPSNPSSTQLAKFADEYSAFTGRLRAIPNGARLEISNDDGGRIIRPPQNCQIVQIVYYADEDVMTGAILVDKEYWNLLDPQNQLALAIHEELYKRLRSFGEKNSARTRKVVGLLFNAHEYPGPLMALYNQPESIYCFADTGVNTDTSISFWVIPLDPNDPLSFATLLFDNLSGNLTDPLLVETTTFSNWTYAEWKGSKTKSSGYIQPTVSALGSETVRFAPENFACPRTGKGCTPTFFLKLPNGKWSGGKVHCRATRQ